MEITTDVDSKLQECVGENYVTIDKIPPWAHYAEEQTLNCYLPDENGGKTEFSVDHEINAKVSVWHGDITTLQVDAIVNAANTYLLAAIVGTVNGDIHNGAGEDLLKECATLQGCTVGNAKITGGYKLPAKYVIHAVGPSNRDSHLLRSAYKHCLDLMLANNLRTIAFPCLSTGFYGFPMQEATHIALGAVRKFMDRHKLRTRIDRVIFVTYSEADKKVYEILMQRYFPTKTTHQGLPTFWQRCKGVLVSK